MKNVQFDSFQKFLVSIGTVLLIAPLLAFQYLLSGAYDVIISAKEYNKLSDISLSLLSVRVKYLNYAFKFGPFVCIFLMLLGIILIVLGCIRWYKIQKLIDDSLQIDHDSKQLELEKQSRAEILTSAIEEVIDSESTDSPENSTTSIEQFVSSESIAIQRVKKYMEIEQKVIDYIKKTLGSSYSVTADMKNNSMRYDAVAVSDTETIVYEIKYWRQFPPRRVYDTINKLKASVEQNNVNGSEHIYRFKLVMVSPNREFVERFQNKLVSGMLPLELTRENVVFLEEKDI